MSSPLSRSELHSAVQPPVNALGNQARTTVLPLRSASECILPSDPLQREVRGLVPDVQIPPWARMTGLPRKRLPRARHTRRRGPVSCQLLSLSLPYNDITRPCRAAVRPFAPDRRSHDWRSEEGEVVGIGREQKKLRGTAVDSRKFERASSQRCELRRAASARR